MTNHPIGSVEWMRERAIKMYPSITHLLTGTYDSMMTAEDKALFEPKRLVPPGGYHSPKCVAASMYMQLGEMTLRRETNEFIAPIQIFTQGVCYEVLNNDVPIYYVSDDLIRAIAATELPKDMKLSELKWPVPAMVLGFPTAFMREYIGEDTCYVLCADMDAGEHSCPKLAGAPIIVPPKHKIAWQWFAWHGGNLESYASSYWAEDEIGKMEDYPYIDYTGANESNVAKNHNATEKVSVLIIKLLCVLNFREGLVTPASVERPEMTIKGTKRPALWKPNFIGASYRLQRESAPEGTHASPKLHLRRGHFTYAVIGKREDLVPVTGLPRIPTGEVDWSQVNEETKAGFWRSHKRIWIDATMVG